MKLLTKKHIEQMYVFYIAQHAMQQLVNKKTDSETDKAISFMFLDMLDIAQNVVGIDGNVALKEVDAINELFETFGYKTNWIKLKASAPKMPPKAHVSMVLKEIVDTQSIVVKTTANTDKPHTVKRAFEEINNFLVLWTSFMCEIIIADRKFEAKERDLLLKYIGEICKYVTIVFGEVFYISKEISAIIEKAIRLCYL